MSEIIYPSWRDVPFLPRPNVDNPSPEETYASSEILPIVDEDGLVVARAPRRYVHGGSLLLHPVVHLHILNRMGEIYLQRRGMNKSLLPGYWDTAVGGHVSFGESIGEALRREAGEELGLWDFNPIPMVEYIFDGNGEREFVHSFAIVGDFKPSPDPSEVSEGRWWSPREIEQNFDRCVLTPNFEQEYRRLENAFSALL